MTETTARIRWEDIASSIDALASRGFVGKLERRSFIIYKPEFGGGQYRLLCLIGDRGGESLYADDPDELKRAAEDWLAGFVSSLGAIFPEAVRSRDDIAGRIDQIIGWAKTGERRDHYVMEREHVDRMRNDILSYAFGVKEAAPAAAGTETADAR